MIALAAVAIALGPTVHLHLEHIVLPILRCFADHDSRVRYYACESMYNVAKVSRSSILTYFNEIFDALAKLSVDSELVAPSN
jgi:vacuole morphology and inheritance protein 14